MQIVAFITLYNFDRKLKSQYLGNGLLYTTNHTQYKHTQLLSSLILTIHIDTKIRYTIHTFTIQ